MSKTNMDHTEAIREMMTEKYLLNELTSEVREDFEEHFFGCPECALDVKAGAALIEHSRTVFSAPAADPISVVANRAPSPKPGWLAWLGPAFAVPALAILLLVVAYQNFVQYPRLKESVAALNDPQILPSVTLTSSRDASIPSVRVHGGEPFLLFLDIPADANFASYKAELQDPAGSLEWTLAIPAELAKDGLNIRVPSKVGGSGVHSLVLYGIAPGTEKAAELRRYRFQLDYQK